MCELLVTILVSSLTGVIASFFVWWLTFKYWVPKIRFSSKISKLKTKENKSLVKYRFKFENYGKRNAIDAEVIVRLRIQGLRKELPNNWEVVYLPTSSLDYKKVAIIRPILKNNSKSNSEDNLKNNLRAILEIKPYECDYFTKDFFPEEIQNKAKEKTLTLEDVLGIGKKAEFQIIIIATDEFSGARKFFESKVYTIDDIAKGYFKKDSLDVVETEEV